MLNDKILIVDDEKMLADLMSQMLHREGYSKVEKASNGLEGVEKYKEFSPDLVIMDIDLPVMDGYESASQIKSIDPDAKILVLTGNPTDDRARKSLDEGLVLSLHPKPLRLADLGRIIRENLTA